MFAKQLIRPLCLLMLFAVLAACSGGGSGQDPVVGAPPPPQNETPPPEENEPPIATGPETATEAAQFLLRSSFGPRQQDIDALLGQSYAEYLDEQINQPPSSHLATLDALLQDNGVFGILSNDEILLRRNLRMDTWWDISLNGDDQLRQRVAFALSQILVVSDLDTLLGSRVRGLAHYYDILAEHAFGNYRDLLQAVTLNPVMGTYLSMRRNEKADPANNIQPDENYARELMQLFTIGLISLNDDGSAVLDQDGNTIPTYGQDEVLTLARVFTGWNFGDADELQTNRTSIDSEILPMKSFEDFHDDDAKTLFGEELPAGQTALEDLQQALDIIFNHPNVGPFVAYRLIQRLTSSNPSSEYIGRVAAVFNNDGNGVRGNLEAVIKAILLDEEVLQASEASHLGKLKEPLLKLSHLFRAFDAIGKRGYIRYTNTLGELGQKPLGAPSVFNFYLPSYSPPGDFATAGLVAPETQILNEPTSISTSNRLLSFIASEQLSNTAQGPIHGVDLDLSTSLALLDDNEALLDHLNTLLLVGRMSDAMRAILLEHIVNHPIASDELIVRELIFLISTSPEFAYQG